jgi:hypothetical protein
MRRLIALPLLAALVVAACGSTTTTAGPSSSAGPAGSVAPSAEATATPVVPAGPTATPAPVPTEPTGSQGPIPSTAPAESLPAATPVPSQTAACAKLNDAIDTIDLYLQVFTSVDRTSWGDMTGPQSPIQFDAKKFAAAIATLAKVEGTAAAVKALQEIDRVMRFALTLKDPFAVGVRTGPRLQQLATDGFVLIEGALVAARQKQSCPQV